MVASIEPFIRIAEERNEHDRRHGMFGLHTIQYVWKNWARGLKDTAISRGAKEG